MQELPRLPRSIVHPEGPVSGINGGYSFKMPGMEGWNAAPLPMGQIQPLPQHHQPQHQQPQQPQQQQGGMGQHLPYPQQLFSQPQQKPGASIGLEHMQVRADRHRPCPLLISLIAPEWHCCLLGQKFKNRLPCPLLLQLQRSPGASISLEHMEVRARLCKFMTLSMLLIA